jgi:multidrug transporter EmrE-like cation transporter
MKGSREAIPFFIQKTCSLVDMSIVNVALMTASEIWGNANFKLFTMNGKHHHMYAGLVGYAGVLIFLIKSLQTGSLLWVSAMWEGMIVVLGSLVAVFVLGENFESPIQWVGVGLGIVSMLLVHFGGAAK